MIDTFRVWAREHPRLSAATVRRRIRVSLTEAEGVVRELVRVGVLDPVPEGESYRVRYPHVPKPEVGLVERLDTYTYPEP